MPVATAQRYNVLSATSQPGTMGAGMWERTVNVESNRENDPWAISLNVIASLAKEGRLP